MSIVFLVNNKIFYQCNFQISRTIHKVKCFSRKVFLKTSHISIWPGRMSEKSFVYGKLVLKGIFVMFQWMHTHANMCDRLQF